jgi:hypothetical protein
LKLETWNLKLPPAGSSIVIVPTKGRMASILPKGARYASMAVHE